MEKGEISRVPPVPEIPSKYPRREQDKREIGRGKEFEKILEKIEKRDKEKEEKEEKRKKEGDK